VARSYFRDIGKMKNFDFIDKGLYSKNPSVRKRQRNVVLWLITLPAIGVFLFVLGNSFVQDVVDESKSLELKVEGTATIQISIIFFALPLGYLVWPPVKKIEKFFKDNESQIVIAYQLVIKILHVSVPIMIVTLLLILLPVKTPDGMGGTEETKTILDFIPKDYEYMIPVLIALAIASGSISFSIFVKWGIMVMQKDFRYVLSKAAIALSVEKEMKINKRIKYAAFAINCYNKYLSRHFDLQIKNPVYIFQRIFSNEETIEQSLMEIKKGIDKGQLGLLSYIEEFAKGSDDEKYLVKITLRQRLIEIGPIIAVVASFVAFVTQIAFTVISGIDDPTSIIDAIDKLS